MDRARVLVVDDEEDILAALRAFLEGSLGVEVVTARSGAIALATLAKEPIDLIVSDYRMPVMDGLQFLGKTAASYPDVPRILLTAYPDMQLAITAVNQAHIARFLTKPVEPEQLGKAVSDLLASTRRKALGQVALERVARPAKEGDRGEAGAHGKAR
jgi:DNA-binding NtrC family response regulator